MDEERWRPVPDWEGFYEVSDRHRVRSLPRRRAPGKILSPRGENRSPRVSLSRNGEVTDYTIAKLVRMAFHGESPQKKERDMAIAQVKALICADCGKTGPAGSIVQDAIDKSLAEGWLIGYHGATISSQRAPGWEQDICPECAPRHPRITCNGVRTGKQCLSKALYKITREGSVTELHSCGSHLLMMLKEMLRGGRKDEGVRVYLME